MFYLGFFVGWFIGVFSALLFLYLIRRETESVADGERVCSNNRDACIGDTFYVETATGEYFIASDLLKKYGRKELARLVASGKLVNEARWEKMKKEKKA